jgi:hypothetical protein
VVLCDAHGATLKKDDGKGPTLAQVKSGARLILNTSLAPPEYTKLAQSIEMTPSASADEADLERTIHDIGIKVYDYHQVDEYLWRLALRQKSPSEWVWKGLRSKDADAVHALTERTHSTSGTVASQQYGRKVPLAAMQTVADVLAKVGPDTKPMFLVSDYETLRPDPFLAVTTLRLLDAGKIWIIAVWDEPGFGVTVDKSNFVAEK